MIGLSVKVEGVDAVREGLRQLDAPLMMEVANVMIPSAQPLFQALEDYPPPIPTSNYVRTYTYLDTLDQSVDQSRDTVQYTAVSGVDYSYWLRGNAVDYDGAWMHKGRWQSLRDILYLYVPIMRDRVDRYVDDFIKRVLP